MKKKLTALTLSLVLALSLVACGGEEKKTETANTNATTETSVASTEKTEEVTPVAEESEPEVVEEAQEEIVEEEIPTDVRGIESYFMENGEVGDFIISEDQIMIVKETENKSISYPIQMINNEIFTKNDKMPIQVDGSVELHTYHREMNIDKSARDTMNNINNKIQQGVYTSIRVTPTDDPNLIKVTCILPDGTMEWIKNVICPLSVDKEEYSRQSDTTDREFGNWLRIYSIANDGGILIPITELDGDAFTFITSKDAILTTEHIEHFNEKLLTPEALTGLVYNSGVQISVVFHMFKSDMDIHSNYTLVTD